MSRYASRWASGLSAAYRALPAESVPPHRLPKWAVSRLVLVIRSPAESKVKHYPELCHAR